MTTCGKAMFAPKVHTEDLYKDYIVVHHLSCMQSPKNNRCFQHY